MMLNIFSCASWPSVCCRLWRNVYLFLLPMSWLGCLVFCCWVLWTVCIFCKLSLVGLIICKYFLPFHWLSFHLFVVSFTIETHLTLISSHLFLLWFDSWNLQKKFTCLHRVLVAACGSFLVAACRILSCSMQSHSFGLWDLVPWPGIKPGPPALGAWCLSHWTTRKSQFLKCLLYIRM